jgi:hypothetical protein
LLLVKPNLFLAGDNVEHVLLYYYQVVVLNFLFIYFSFLVYFFLFCLRPLKTQRNLFPVLSKLLFWEKALWGFQGHEMNHGLLGCDTT